MHTIEFFVGPKYGGWKRGSRLFTDKEAAKDLIWSRMLQETIRGLTPIARRVVPA